MGLFSKESCAFCGTEVGALKTFQAGDKGVYLQRLQAQDQLLRKDELHKWGDELLLDKKP